MIKRIFIDTREQVFAHIETEIKLNNISIKRKKLDAGDYSFETIYKNYENIVIVERKHSLDELATNFTRDRDRFKRELIRAYESGAKTILLIEDATQQDILNHNYRSKFHPNAFIGSLNSWHKKYNMDVFFCRKKYSGKAIIKIFNDFI